MKLQKKHIIYAGLIGVALAAWGIDAMFFESPRASEAAAVPAPATEAPAQHLPGVSEPNPGSQWLTHQLRTWSQNNPIDQEQARDLFAVPHSWAPARPATAPAAANVAAQSAEDFQREHHLAAVMVSGRGRSALIDGRLVRIGQTVAGCRLSAVSKGRADFIAPDGSQFHLLIGPEERSDK